jgi:hypothetical protein
MPLGVLICIALIGAAFYWIIRSAPYQCPQCGAIMHRYDYCQRCGWSMTRHTRG